MGCSGPPPPASAVILLLLPPLIGAVTPGVLTTVVDMLVDDGIKAELCRTLLLLVSPFLGIIPASAAAEAVEPSAGGAAGASLLPGTLGLEPEQVVQDGIRGGSAP